MDNLRWQNWTLLALGLYVCVTPWLFAILFSYSEVPTRMVLAQSLTGGFLVVVAYLALLSPKAWHEAFKVVIGFWLIVLPWTIDFNGFGALTYNNLLCGYLAVLLGGLALVARRPSGGCHSF